MSTPSVSSLVSAKTLLVTAALGVFAYLLYRKHNERRKEVKARTAAGREHFSTMAKRYDQHPAVKVILPATIKALASASTAGGILPFALSPQRTDALDFGCGPGSLALALSPFVRSVLAVDTAPG